MKKLLLAASILLTGSVSAQTVTVIHGIDGRDLGQAQALPVDISINGSCTLQGVSYKGISSPLNVPAGVYNVEVRVSNGSCTGALAATGRFDLGLTENASVIAHLNEQGAPKITKFTNDLRDARSGRASIRHAAAAPDVFVVLQSRAIRVPTEAFQNGEQTDIDAPAANYRATIFAPNGISSTRVAAPTVTVRDSELLAVYAVGSVKGRTFSVITQRITLSN